MCIGKVIKFLDRREVKLFITFLIVYCFFINWYGWNEESNLALTKAIAEENRFEIDSFHNLTGDRSVYNERYYSDKSPGLSFLTTPVYTVWKLFYYNVLPQDITEAQKGTKEYLTVLHDSIPIYTYIDPGSFVLNTMYFVTAFTSSIFSTLTAVLIYRLSKKVVRKERYRIAITIAYALGTLAFPYALHFMTHATGAFFAFFAFYLLFNSKDVKNEKKYKYLFLAGLLLGFAGVVDNIFIITIPFFLVYVLLSNLHKQDRKNFLLFFFTLMIGILPLMIYNYTIFGSPLKFSSTYIDRQIYKSAYNIDSFDSILSSLKPQTQQFVKYSAFSSIESLLKQFHLVPDMNPYVIVRLLFGPYRGLFFYSPILLLSFLGLYWMFKKHKLEVAFIFLVTLSILFIISMRINWWGGYAFGNRYLMSIVPFLFVPLLHAVEKINFKIVLLLILLSIFINFLGLQPAEDYAYDWNIMIMRQSWFEKQNSFEIFYNPLIQHYWPGFWKIGPRSPLFENLSNGHLSIDTRISAISKGTNFPFSAFYVPFLCLVPLAAIISLIWSKEIRTYFKC